MKKVIIIIVILSTININKLQSQTTADTLQWLKTNIEADSNYFKGKYFSILLDSLKGYKSAISEYSGPSVPGLGLVKVDTIWVNQFDLYFQPFLFSYKSSLHTNCFYSNNFNDTVNTHINFIRVKFQNKIPFLLKWWSYDKLSLGSHKWNKSLALLYGNAIVESVSVGEF